MEPFFQRELFLERDGIITKIVATVHGFSSKENGTYYCTVSLDQIEDRPIAIAQIDKLSSLLLALSFLDQRIRSMEQQGWSIWWLEKGDRGELLGLPLDIGP